MEIKDFEELVLTRQSTRDFTDREIEKEKLKKIVSLSLNSPSACNSQPWVLHVVSGEKVKDVADALMYKGRNSFLKTAKAFIVIEEVSSPLMADVENRFGKDYFVKYDVGEITAYLTLSAKVLGVDSCIIGWMDREAICRILGAKNVSIAIALGYSNVPLRKKSRKEQNQTVVFEE